jgi:DNA-directed RNA polymerase specialized sigma24 family protein
MCQLAEQLRQLAMEAQNNPSNSVARRKVLNNLVKLVQSSGQLSKQKRWSQLPNFEEIYQEAVNDAFVKLCKSIDNYNPQYPVMAWVNHIFRWCFLDVVNRYRERTPISFLDEEAGEEKLFKDFVEAEGQSKEDANLFRDFIETDPEGILQELHIKRDRSTSLQMILISLCDGKEWKDISRTFGHPIPTLSSFYQRSIKKRNVVEYCRKYLQ